MDRHLWAPWYHTEPWQVCVRPGHSVICGFEITPDKVRPCKKYLYAIREFPTPANITDNHSLLCLINQVSYAFASAERMLPFRVLLKPGTPFTWDDELNTVFHEPIAVIIAEIENGVRIFDKSKPTCLATDWSKTGIGYWLFQKHCHCPSTEPFCCRTGWNITTSALAVADALDKARFFVLGCSDLTIAVDHKPLLKLFGDRSLNARLRNLKEKTLRYRFRMVHIPGMRHKAADAVSRYPTGSRLPELLHLPDDVASTSDSASPLPTILECSLLLQHHAQLPSMPSWPSQHWSPWQSHGRESNWRPQATRTWCSLSPQLKQASPIPDTNCHSHSRSTTNLGMTSTPWMGLSYTRTASSSHHHSDRMSWPYYISRTRVWPPWPHVLRRPCSGLASPPRLWP